MAARTALIHDEEMTRHSLLWEDPVCKIEVPERLMGCYEALKKVGIVQRCVCLPAREATDEEILLAHSKEYLDAVKQTSNMSVDELLTFTRQYGDVYFHPSTYHCAKLAIGATLNLIQNVMTGQVRNGMALVRPPGHHSQRSAANGFCIFNNVAIGALYAKKNFNIRRVLIVDWDVHHGQGLQYYFEEDPDVLYFSWHRYEHQQFWPNLRESDFDSVGKGKGAGFNMNLPWNKVGMHNSDYLSVFFHVLLPAAYEFDPELVLVSAGFDSAIGDPEGHMCATPEVFGHLTHLLMSLAGGRLCAILEGGYNLTSLPQSVCQTVHTLLGDPVSRIPALGSPCKSALESIQCVRAVHQPYWACFTHAATNLLYEPGTKRPKLEVPVGAANLEEGPKEVSWPEPLPRVAPQVRTAVVLPPGWSDHVPKGCELVREETGDTLRNPSKGEVKMQDTQRPLGDVLLLIDKIVKKEVLNGLAVVSDLSQALTSAVNYALTSLKDRVLVVFLGNATPVEVQQDGKIMLIQFCSTEPESSTYKYHVPLWVKQDFSDLPGFLHAVLGLLLPLAYSYDPGLTLVAANEGSRLLPAAWAQLTSLLLGLAQGQVLALLHQGAEKEAINATAASLLGQPAPPLGSLGPPLSQSLKAVEGQRCRLQKQWGLLQTEGKISMMTESAKEQTASLKT